MQKTHGFSLLELAIVLGVMAALSTTMLPGVISATRQEYAGKMVDDLRLLQEAAEAFYGQNDQWPAQNLACNQNPSTLPVNTLVREGFLTAPLRDPFSNETYRFAYAQRNAKCLLEIHTPHNEKLSAVLPKIKTTLELFRQPICIVRDATMACAFTFAEPSLGLDEDARIKNAIDTGIEDFTRNLADKMPGLNGNSGIEQNAEAPSYPEPIRSGHKAVCAAGYRAQSCTNSYANQGYGCDVLGRRSAACDLTPVETCSWNRPGWKCSKSTSDPNPVCTLICVHD
jgi:type II secretory pathway pseudopilin PulG